jgi:hypothetical protein
MPLLPAKLRRSAAMSRKSFASPSSRFVVGDELAAEHSLEAGAHVEVKGLVVALFWHFCQALSPFYGESVPLPPVSP